MTASGGEAQEHGAREYLARPAGPAGATFPGVVVVHDIFGMTPDLRRQADRLAVGGYLALAPDLWHGRPWPTCVRSAFRQVMSGRGPAFEEIDAAAATLAARADCTGRIGVAGFCMGGGFALLCAPRAGYSAVSANYAPIPRDLSLLDGACPVVASYAGKDRRLTKEVPRLEQALTEREVPHDIEVYPQATHAFMNDHDGAHRVLTRIMGMRFDATDASDSWRRIFAFFGEHLAGAGSPPGEA